jgi:ABC-type uncharacterized transport system substrate-binding protein
VIVACATPIAHAVKTATSTVPVVMAPVADPLSDRARCQSRPTRR